MTISPSVTATATAQAVSTTNNLLKGLDILARLAGSVNEVAGLAIRAISTSIRPFFIQNQLREATDLNDRATLIEGLNDTALQSISISVAAITLAVTGLITRRIRGRFEVAVAVAFILGQANVIRLNFGALRHNNQILNEERTEL